MPGEFAVRRDGPWFFTFLALSVVVFWFCLIAGFGIGLLLLPIPVAMWIGLLLWRWKPVVVGLLASATAGSVTFIVKAPLTHQEMLRGLETSERALLLAVGAALLAGGIGAAGAWMIQRRARRR